MSLVSKEAFKNFLATTVRNLPERHVMAHGMLTRGLEDFVLPPRTCVIHFNIPGTSTVAVLPTEKILNALNVNYYDLEGSQSVMSLSNISTRSAIVGNPLARGGGYSVMYVEGDTVPDLHLDDTGNAHGLYSLEGLCYTGPLLSKMIEHYGEGVYITISCRPVHSNARLLEARMPVYSRDLIDMQARNLRARARQYSYFNNNHMSAVRSPQNYSRDSKRGLSGPTRNSITKRDMNYVKLLGIRPGNNARFKVSEQLSGMRVGKTLQNSRAQNLGLVRNQMKSFPTVARKTIQYIVGGIVGMMGHRSTSKMIGTHIPRSGLFGIFGKVMLVYLLAMLVSGVTTASERGVTHPFTFFVTHKARRFVGSAIRKWTAKTNNVVANTNLLKQLGFNTRNPGTLQNRYINHKMNILSKKSNMTVSKLDKGYNLAVNAMLHPKVVATPKNIWNKYASLKRRERRYNMYGIIGKK